MDQLIRSGLFLIRNLKFEILNSFFGAPTPRTSSEIKKGALSDALPGWVATMS